MKSVFTTNQTEIYQYEERKQITVRYILSNSCIGHRASEQQMCVFCVFWIDI